MESKKLPKIHIAVRRLKPGEKPAFTREELEAMLKLALEQRAAQRENASEPR